MTIKRWSADAWDAIKGNGCTGAPDLYLETACQRHDRHYETHQHRDGRPISRLEADWEFAKDAWKSLTVLPEGPMTIKKAAMVPVRLVVKNVLPVAAFALVRSFGWLFWGSNS